MEQANVALAYEEVGQGLPVVLVHGFPLDHTIWNPIVPLLKDHARLIMPDLRGFGRSPVTPGVYSMRTLAQDLLALLDRLQIGRAVLVGHSMGGYVSLAFAQAYPNRLAGLGMVASHAAADSLERRQGRLNSADEVSRRGVRHLVANMAPRLTSHADLVEPLKTLMMGADPRAVAGSLRGMAERPAAESWLSSIAVPTLVLVGAQDSLVPLDAARTMTQLLGRAWLVEVPDAAHMPMMEAPQATADAIRQLIRAAREMNTD